MKARYKEVLSEYFPEGTIQQVSSFIETYAIQLKLTRSRITKLGDYRPSVNGNPHRISINGSLNPFVIYLVFLHELAHLKVWVKYKNQVSPHGKQWKEEFSGLLKYAVYHKLVPEELHQPLLAFSQNIKATFASAPQLWSLLKTYNKDDQTEITLEQIPDNTFFQAANGKVFKKEEKLRKRFRCYCLNNHRRYLFHPMAVVEPLGLENTEQSDPPGLQNNSSVSKTEYKSN